MTDLRDMELLAALGRHRHFARAAEACGISQPAFSARIRNLELQLGVPIVKRGNRFLGFTAEGEITLKWAHRLLTDAEGLSQAIQEAKGALSGRVAIGVVPTALTYASRAPRLLRAAHPAMTVQIVSASSAEIRQKLEDVSLDAGITYLDVAMPAAARAVKLYDERYVLIAPPGLVPPRRTGAITWREAAALPLCLLTPNMRNRRILDEAFASVGARPEPMMETNAFTALIGLVAQGAAATIAPEVLADALILPRGTVRLALIEPDIEKPIGLVTSDLEPTPPAIRALIAALVPGGAPSDGHPLNP